MKTIVTAGDVTYEPPKKKTEATKETTPAAPAVQPNVVEASADNTAASEIKDYSPPQTNNAGQNQPTQTAQPTAVQSVPPQGYMPIRQTLTGRGIADSRIGYKDGYVTIDGQQMFRPQYNADGTTYASEADINTLTNQAYIMNNTPLVSTRDYVAGKGYGAAVDWDGTNPTIGGIAVKPAYITSDGVSYIDRNAADKAIADYEKRNGIITNKGVLDAREEKYGSVEQEALDKIINREAFSYDPESDPAYQSYKKQYDRAAEEALRRVLNDNNTSIAGASGAVLSEAIASHNYEKQKAQDKIPELYRDAFERYVTESDMDRADLSDITSVADSFLNRTYRANRDQIGDSLIAQQTENDEEDREFDHQYKKLELGYAPRMFETDAALQEEALKQTLFENTISQAQALGRFLPEHEQFIPSLAQYRNADGTYSISPYDAEVLYNTMIANADYKAQYDARLKYGIK